MCVVAATVGGQADVEAQEAAPPPDAGAPVDPPPVPPALPPDPEAEAEGRADITTTEALAAQPATRAFGPEPYLYTVGAAGTEAAQRRASGCALSDARLAGTMLAITFTEAGPLASTTTAPSPMTLSRWDTQAVLYSFGSTSTRYPRAFWHPGVGLWQFDHPWQNTAAERIDTRSAAILAAEVIAGRWCGWTSATGMTRFQYTVRPWHGCNDETGAGNRCLGIFTHHFRANTASLADDALVGFTGQPGVTRFGGARPTTCRLARESVDRPCLYVNPAAAQGHRAWAATSGLPTPLAAPFYVVTVGTREWRYWLRADTGYDRDIVATAVIGSNPRSTLVWQTGQGLCDLGARRGACGPPPLPSSEAGTWAVASSATGRLDMFAVSGTASLAYRSRSPAGAWSRVTDLGGALRSQPAAVSWAPGRLDVFVRGTDNILWHRGHTGGAWSAWRSLGGRLTSAPAAATWAPGRLDVFVRGTDNALWHRWHTGGAWSAWRSLGGTLTSSPAATSHTTGTIDVVARGGPDTTYHRAYTAGRWSPWRSLGGTLTSQPALASPGDGLLDLVTRGTNGGFWLRRWARGAGWGGWTSLGGQLTTGPGATADATRTTLTVTGRSPNGAAYLTTRPAPTQPWTPWTRIP